MRRDKALKIVRDHVKNENLVKHMLAVEAAMRAYARKFIDEARLETDDPEATIERWGNAGLLHDFDWEIHPTLEQHPQAGAEILRDQGVDEDMIETILAHAPHTGVPRDTLIKKALFASDEITGLITTTALVRPSKKIADVKLKSIKKKWKQKSFAAGVNREEVEQGAEELGIPLWEHVDFVLKAMQSISDDLGL